MLSSAVAPAVSRTASQVETPIFSVPSAALKSATKMTFEPSTGVATETSPRLRARKVKIWPMKKIVPEMTAWLTLPKVAAWAVGTNQNSAKSVACTQFVEKFTRHGPAPWVPRLSIIAAKAYPSAEPRGTSMGEANDMGEDRKFYRAKNCSCSATQR